MGNLLGVDVIVDGVRVKLTVLGEFLDELWVLGDSFQCLELVFGEKESVAQVGHKGVRSPSQEVFDLSFGAPCTVQDNACADSK